MTAALNTYFQPIHAPTLWIYIKASTQISIPKKSTYTFNISYISHFSQFPSNSINFHFSRSRIFYSFARRPYSTNPLIQCIHLTPFTLNSIKSNIHTRIPSHINRLELDALDQGARARAWKESHYLWSRHEMFLLVSRCLTFVSHCRHHFLLSTSLHYNVSCSTSVSLTMVYRPAKELWN